MRKNESRPKAALVFLCTPIEGEGDEELTTITAYSGG
jgi:hypothetical protein